MSLLCFDSDEPHVVSTSLVVKIVEEGPFLSVIELDPDISGSSRKRGGRNLKDLSPSPLRIIPMGDFIATPEKDALPIHCSTRVGLESGSSWSPGQ